MVDKAMGRLAILQIELELNSLVIRSLVNKQNSEHLVQELKNRLSAENFQRAGDGVDKIFFTVYDGICSADDENVFYFRVADSSEKHCY